MSEKAKKECILIVEDDDGLRQLMEKMLEVEGYQVLSASDAWEGQEICTANHGNIDLVVTDIVMPVITGAEMVSNMRQSQPNLKILFTSGYSEKAVQFRGLLDSGAPFVPKPFTMPAFTSKVREVLDSEQVLDFEEELG